MMKIYKKEISEEEKEKIIREFLPFIKYTAHRLSWGLPPQLSVDDLISVGIMGLLDALQRYTEGRVKLNTFVQFRIKGAMLDELRSHNWVPKSMNKKISNIKNAYLKLEKEFGRVPEDIEIIDYLGISTDEYYEILRIANTQRIYRFEDFNDRNYNNEDLDALECISDSEAKTPLDIFEEKELKKMLASVIEKMPEKEKMVLSLYYWEEMTMKEIAHVMNLTEGRVCQLHSQAVTRLKTKLTEDEAKIKDRNVVAAVR